MLAVNHARAQILSPFEPGGAATSDAAAADPGSAEG
jgi:hypothetical protein